MQGWWRERWGGCCVVSLRRTFSLISLQTAGDGKPISWQSVFIYLRCDVNISVVFMWYLDDSQKSKPHCWASFILSFILCCLLQNAPHAKLVCVCVCMSMVCVCVWEREIDDGLTKQATEERPPGQVIGWNVIGWKSGRLKKLKLSPSCCLRASLYLSLTFRDKTFYLKKKT